MSCDHCKKPLHTTHNSVDNKQITCASCSKKHGTTHVYYERNKFHADQHTLKGGALCMHCKVGKTGPHKGYTLCNQIDKA